MNLINVVQSRYSTKEFDASKKVSAELFEQIKALLRFSPSSVNSQPWHFIIADSEQGRKRIAKGTQGIYRFNEPKVLNASYVIIFCAKTEINDAYMQHLLAVEDEAGRFADTAAKNKVHGTRSTFMNMHRFDFKDAQHWMEKQLYLNMGTVLLGAATLGIDALPMEGIDTKALDEEFGLREKGLTAVVVVSLGYRKKTDANATLPKARLPEDEIFTFL
jgi:nitroreductase/dihydropteridine reductase